MEKLNRENLFETNGGAASGSKLIGLIDYYKIVEKPVIDFDHGKIGINPPPIRTVTM